MSFLNILFSLQMMEQPGWVDLYQGNDPNYHQGDNPTENQGANPTIIEERSTCWAG